MFLFNIQFSSVAQSCLNLCDPMNRSMPGLPVHHQLPEFTQTHAHRVGDAIQPSHPVVTFSSCPQSLPASGSFPMSQLFAWGGQSTGVSASASVLPMNTLDLSTSGWTGWISLQSKGLSRVFSNTTVLCSRPQQIPLLISPSHFSVPSESQHFFQPISWPRNAMTTWLRLGFPGGSAGKESVCNEEDLGSIPGLGRSPGEGKGYPLQYSGLKNSMDCIVHGVTKSWTQLSSFHFTWLRLGFWPRHCYKDEITVSVRMSC